MIVLFSPSEDKNFIYETNNNKDFSFLDNLIFNELNSHRLDILNSYIKFLKYSSSRDIARIFGQKIIKDLDTISACSNICNANIIQSIYLYNGVAFKALDMKSIPKHGIDFIMNNVIIFSNLFGAIRASDKIPYYKLKQGESFFDNNINSIYKGFDTVLDNYLKGNEILDLRAEFYNKAYKIKFPHTKINFIKNGKKSTHYAKYYRGLLLRNIAINGKITHPFKLISSRIANNIRILEYEVLE